jgi:uncharacterized protein YcfJ
MMRKFGIAVFSSLALLIATNSAQAAGCLKGAVVGGIAGHVAGHHAIVGAMAGCAIGHHMAKNAAKAREQPQSTQGRPQSS